MKNERTTPFKRTDQYEENQLRRKKRRKNEEVPDFSLQSFSPRRRVSGYNTENQKLKTDSSCFRLRNDRIWSGRRDLNSRPSPWQGDALPLSYSRFFKEIRF